MLLKWCTQFSSVAQSCLTLCNPMNPTMPGLPVHHQLPRLVKLVSIESVMPSNHLILCHPSPPGVSLSQHQGLFQWVSSSHQVARVLEFQLQHQSFQWLFMTDFLLDWLVWSCSPVDSKESSWTSQFRSINSSALSFLYGPTLISFHVYWKHHSFD